MGVIDDPQMAALFEPTRFEVIGLLMRTPEGLPAGEIARKLGVPQNLMSAHTRKLADAGLISAEKRGRQNIYRAVPDQVRSLMRRLAIATGTSK